MFCQIIIAVAGMATVTCLASKSRRSRFAGCLIGAFAVPAWLYDASCHAQYGLLILALWHLIFYVRGAWNNRNKV